MANIAENRNMPGDGIRTYLSSCDVPGTCFEHNYVRFDVPGTCFEHDYVHLYIFGALGNRLCVSMFVLTSCVVFNCYVSFLRTC